MKIVRRLVRDVKVLRTRDGAQRAGLSGWKAWSLRRGITEIRTFQGRENRGLRGSVVRRVERDM